MLDASPKSSTTNANIDSHLGNNLICLISYRDILSSIAYFSGEWFLKIQWKRKKNFRYMMNIT